jgi:nitrous oxide reductase accessory protein NosL
MGPQHLRRLSPTSSQSRFPEVTMKRLVLAALLLALFGITALLHAADTVEPPASCQYCGMDRTRFAHSRMLLKYEDGTIVGTCSINCAAIDLKEKAGRKATSIQVADYNTRQLIDARSAAWVMGGDKKGVMTMLPKWAFARAGDATAFIAANGGKPATYDEVLKAAGENPKQPMHKMEKPKEEQKTMMKGGTQPAGCDCGCENCAMSGRPMTKESAQPAPGGCENCMMRSTP